MKHELKCWPEYFEQVRTGYKNFEVRLNDRNFSIGDILVLKEWDPVNIGYTGRKVTRIIGYMMEGGKFGIEQGYAILGLTFRSL